MSVFLYEYFVKSTRMSVLLDFEILVISSANQLISHFSEISTTYGLGNSLTVGRRLNIKIILTISCLFSDLSIGRELKYSRGAPVAL